MAAIPELVTNLEFDINGRPLSHEEIFGLLEALVPNKPMSKEERTKSLDEKLMSINFSKSDYLDLCMQEPFKRLLFDYAYFKLLFPRIPAYLELLAQGIEVGKETCMKQALQILMAYHPQLQPAPTTLENHQHLHLKSLTPRQLQEDYERLAEETKSLLARANKK